MMGQAAAVANPKIKAHFVFDRMCWMAVCSQHRRQAARSSSQGSLSSRSLCCYADIVGSAPTKARCGCAGRFPADIRRIVSCIAAIQMRYTVYGTQFPQPKSIQSRSYDAALHAVRFWGHDGAMEVSFFVNEDALKRMQPELRPDEAGILDAFDANRPPYTWLLRKLIGEAARVLTGCLLLISDGQRKSGSEIVAMRFVHLAGLTRPRG
jgi:uncharacterized protein DUF1488